MLSQSANEIINSALNNYRVEIIGGLGSWKRVFIAAPDIKTARTLGKVIKAEFVANLANKKAKINVKRVFLN